MAILTKGHTFADSDAVTSTKLNNLVDSAAFVAGSSGSTDDASLEVSAGQMRVKDSGITSAKLAASAVTNAKLVTSTSTTTGVTYNKIQYVANMKALGNVSGSATSPSEVSILDEDDMVSDSATSLVTQQSVKAYVDTQLASAITVGTAVTSTSGTAVTFTGVPSTAKRITVMLDGVSATGTNDMAIQLGTSGGFEATGYVGAVSYEGGRSSFTTYYQITDGLSSSSTVSGTITFVKIDGNTWIGTAAISRGDNSFVFTMAGSKTLSGVLTQFELILSSTNTFDAGKVNVLYE